MEHTGRPELALAATGPGHLPLPLSLAGPSHPHPGRPRRGAHTLRRPGQGGLLRPLHQHHHPLEDRGHRHGIVPAPLLRHGRGRGAGGDNLRGLHLHRHPLPLYPRGRVHRSQQDPPLPDLAGHTVHRPLRLHALPGADVLLHEEPRPHHHGLVHARLPPAVSERPRVNRAVIAAGRGDLALRGLPAPDRQAGVEDRSCWPPSAP